MSDPILHSTLRQATLAWHRRLDHHPVLTPLLRDGGPSLAEYSRALLGLLRFHDPVERLLIAHPLSQDCPMLRRSLGLRQDLAALGVAAPDPMSWAGPFPHTDAEYMGIRYVIEGSAMGGRVIHRLLRASLPQSCQTALRFFQGEPDDGGWGRFWVLADNLPNLDRDEMVRAAVATFSHLSDSLDGC